MVMRHGFQSLRLSRTMDKSKLRGRAAFWVVLIMSFSASNVFAQTPKWCSFWSGGNTRYRGDLITSSDVIEAFDPRGAKCGQATGGYNGVPGSYLLYVHNAHDGSPYPGGAQEGESISFRINGEAAYVVAGSNVWHDNGSYLCDLDVAEGPPTADANGPYFGMEGSAIQFDGSGSSGANSYLWNFGNGGSSSEMSPSYTYPDNGTFNVSLTVQNTVGSDVAYTTASISNVAPTVSINSDKTTLNEGETVNFTSSVSDPGSADILSYSWVFGDGGTSSSTNPSHNYLDDGNFTATLTVNDGDGGIGSDNIPLTVANVPPQNVNAGGDVNVSEGTPIGFSGSATDPGANDVLSFDWNFGNGQSASGRNVNYTYPDDGVFTVTLTVSDGDGGVVPDQLTATISNVPPTANAGGPYTNVVLNVPVQFNGSATDPGVNDVLTYKWDLDNDGQYDDFTGPNPTKTYSQVGTYTVSLEVTDDDGGRDTDNATVEVITGIQVTFDTSPPGLSLIVDGETITTPRTFWWLPATNHSLEAPLIHNASSVMRYLFSGWSDGGNRIHLVVTPGSATTYTAVYATQYKLTVDDGGVGANPKGGGWYFGGVSAQFSVDDVVTNPAGTSRFTFQGWTGTGGGHYTGSNNPAQVTMSGPITQTATWQVQHYLDVRSAYGSVSGNGWYDEGSPAQFEVTPTTVSLGQGRRSVFQNWTGEGSGSYSGGDPSATVMMNNPIVEIVNWRDQFLLETNVNPPNSGTVSPPPPGGWYDSGQIVTLNASPFSGFQWVEWSGNLTGNRRPETLRMDGPKYVTANFGRKVPITIKTEPEGLGIIVDGNTYTSPRTFDWVQNTTHTLSVPSPQGGTADMHYEYDSWSDGGNRTHTYHVPGTAETVTAYFNRMYYVGIAIEPEGAGDTAPIQSPGGWALANATIEITAIGDGEQRYGFSHWTGDVSTTENPVPLFVDGPKQMTAHFRKGEVYLESEPPGATIIADGIELETPAVMVWFGGTEHVIEAPSPQGDSQEAIFTFLRWSDEGERVHSIVIPDEMPVTYTAFFDAQYYLEVRSDHGTPQGQGLYPAGTTVDVSVDSVVQENEFLRRYFTGWVGTGNGSVTSPDRTIQVTVNGRITEVAQWRPMYKLDLQTNPWYAPPVTLHADPPGPWYEPGTWVSLSMTVTDPNWEFVEWRYEGFTSTEIPLSVRVNEPIQVVALFDAPNFPPQIYDIPVVVLLEDHPLKQSFGWWAQYVVDPNDPISILDVQFTAGSHLEFTKDDEQEEIIIVPEANWYGEQQVQISVIDPTGLGAQGTFTTQVLPVNDVPGPFNLIYPPDDTTIAPWSWPILFVWETSENLDSEDSITYTYYLSRNPDLTKAMIALRSLPDTSLAASLLAAGTYYWGVWAEDTYGKKVRCDDVFQFSVTQTDVEAAGGAVPEAFNLWQNYPNPFNPLTTVPFELPVAEHVRIRILDMRGVTVRSLMDRRVEAGRHEIVWDGKDDAGRRMPSGLYLIHMQAGTYVMQRKMLFIQ